MIYCILMYLIQRNSVLSNILNSIVVIFQLQIIFYLTDTLKF